MDHPAGPVGDAVNLPGKPVGKVAKHKRAVEEIEADLITALNMVRNHMKGEHTEYTVCELLTHIRKAREND